MYEWDVTNYEKFEPDSPEYILKKKHIAFEKNIFMKIFLENGIYLKYAVSFIVFLIFVCTITFYQSQI